jgi:uncharacterized protein (TIGR02246 family)
MSTSSLTTQPEKPMLKMTKVAVSTAVFAIACGSTFSPPTGPRSTASYEKGGVSASQSIDEIQNALNAAWAAKDAARYAAPFAEAANIITPIGTVLAGRPAIEARHVVLFGGPLAHSTQIVTFQRIQMLTGTIAIVDGDAVVTNGGVVSRTLVRWVLSKNGGVWQIEAQQSTPAA